MFFQASFDIPDDDGGEGLSDDEEWDLGSEETDDDINIEHYSDDDGTGTLNLIPNLGM